MQTYHIDGRERIGVVLPARMVPDGVFVKKTGGESVYTIHDCVRAFLADGQRHEVRATEGAKFLHSGRGNFYAVSADTLLVWLAHPDDLIDWLETHFGETPR